MRCRFCNQDKTLVRAHVIPEGFFRRLRDGEDPPRMLSNVENTYPKRSPIGVYDTEILCIDCETQFGNWDQYAQELLTNSLTPAKEILHNNQIVGYEISDYNYEKLKLFFISLLWRASVSVQPFYEKVRLGQYEEIAKTHINNKDPGAPDDFAITLAKFDHALGQTILDPHGEKWEGVKYYRFYFGGYVAYIKVDKRLAPPPLGDFVIAPAAPLRIIARNLDKSKELQIIKNVVTGNKALHGSGQKRGR